MPGGRARSIDANQTEIVHDLQKVGATVRTLQLEAEGLPDLIVGFREVNYLLEIKTDKGELTPAQVAFFLEWRGQKAIVRSSREALAVLGLVPGVTAPVTVLSQQEIHRYVANPAQSRVVWSMADFRKRKGRNR